MRLIHVKLEKIRNSLFVKIPKLIAESLHLKEGEEIEIDLSVTKEQYETVVKPIFQRAVDLSLKLLKNNNLTGSDLTTVLMIGGPTFSETVRDMIREQITEKVDISIDPMIAVAQGAALYASTKDIPDDIRAIDNSKIQLKLSYQ